MIRLLNPNNSDFKSRREVSSFAVACSGGYDSMAVLAFFINGGWKPLVIHVDHCTGNSGAITPIQKLCKAGGLDLVAHLLNPDHKNSKESWEEFWRNERMRIFDSYSMPVVTGHNLDDAMETWMFGAMHGQPKLIPYNTGNVYRPFLLTRKQVMLDYVKGKGIEWFEDKTNRDPKYPRNRIRHHIMPEVEQINVGFSSVIKRKYLEKYNNVT